MGLYRNLTNKTVMVKVYDDPWIRWVSFNPRGENKDMRELPDDAAEFYLRVKLIEKVEPKPGSVPEPKPEVKAVESKIAETKVETKIIETTPKGSTKGKKKK